ncbi:hypothetical protein Hanom_Chr11g01025511 [Helianthus anomalus]
MSDKWPKDSENVPVLLLDCEGKLPLSAFPTFAGIMGARPLRDGEEFWLEQIRPKFMYARIEAFVVPPIATEGAHIPNLRPCRAITSAGKTIVYFSSEESVASFEHELNPSHDLFAGVLRKLSVDPEEKKPKRVSKKKITVAEGAAMKKAEVTGATSDVASQKGTLQFRQSTLEDFVYVADSVEELYAIGGKPQGNVEGVVRSSGSAGSKGPDVEETGAEPDAEELIRKNALKRSRAEAKTETTPLAKKVATCKPIGKKGSLRSHYYEASREVSKNPDARLKTTVLPPKTVAERKEAETSKVGEKPLDVALEIEKAPEVAKVVGTDRPMFERMGTEARVENFIAHQVAPYPKRKCCINYWGGGVWWR